MVGRDLGAVEYRHEGSFCGLTVICRAKIENVLIVVNALHGIGFHSGAESGTSRRRAWKCAAARLEIEAEVVN